MFKQTEFAVSTEAYATSSFSQNISLSIYLSQK